jgi:formylglycine-generating enzyme required for sulfatase activity
MAIVPAHEWAMTVVYRERECGFYRDPALRPLTPAVLDQVAERFRSGLAEFGSVGNGELHQAVVATRPAKVGRFAIDLTPVTNAEFARFLRASRYSPPHRESFLKHWNGSDAPPHGLEDHPVVYVDLTDARAYAAWAGKRLPTEEKWQLAAQGTDGRLYPWGNDWLADRCNAAGPTTTPVRAFPLGRSPFGCFDMIGNTWEWTESERRDSRTRFAILKGGSFYRATGSDWYADGGPRYCNYASKFVLLWPGLDRCATIGFRCAADAD